MASPSFDIDAFDTDAFDVNAFDIGATVVPVVPTGVISYGSGGGGIGRERKKRWGALLNEALLAPAPKTKGVPERPLSKREREKAQEIERLLTSTSTALPARPAPKPVVSVHAVVDPVQVAAVQLETLDAEAPERARIVSIAAPYRIAVAPVELRVTDAEVIDNLSDDDMEKLMRLAHELSQPRLPKDVMRPGRFKL